MEPDDPQSWDPYLRYRRKHPKFPGVKTCVEYLHRGNVQGELLYSVMLDLEEHAAAAGTVELAAAFRAETDSRVRRLLLRVIAGAPSPADLSLYVEVLAGSDDGLLYDSAARGLHRIGTPEAKQALWQARSRAFADPAEAARFRQMLDDVKRGD